MHLWHSGNERWRHVFQLYPRHLFADGWFCVLPGITNRNASIPELTCNNWFSVDQLFHELASVSDTNKCTPPSHTHTQRDHKAPQHFVSVNDTDVKPWQWYGTNSTVLRHIHCWYEFHHDGWGTGSAPRNNWTRYIQMEHTHTHTRMRSRNDSTQLQLHA